MAMKTDQICYECPVRKRCLEWAVHNQATGTHGAVYLSLGKYAKNRNKHKTPEQAEKLIAEVNAINGNIRMSKKAKNNNG